MKVTCHAFDLPLRHAFTISRETHTVQPTFVVELGQGDCRGYGEATTNNYYGVTRERLEQAVSRVRPLLHDWELASPQGDGRPPTDLWEALHADLADAPFALCAIDLAAHDLWGKLHGRRVYEMWGLKPQSLPASCFTIGIDRVDVMVEKLQEEPHWPVYKIKLGTDQDLEIVETLRQHTTAPFRVDANGGWTVTRALQLAPQLKALGVEFIEQPLPAGHWKDQRHLYTKVELPLFADESCLTEADVMRCADHFHGINIKLVKCGGLTPARRMIRAARTRGLDVMVGCMTESTVGISAIAQLLPEIDYVDMDGAALLSADIATGVWLERGVCRFSQEPGCGVHLLDNAPTSE